MRLSRLIPVSICLIGMLLLQNCGPGDCEEHVPINTEYTISSADKSKIPFTGTDTLVYISTDGDTATLYGQGKKTFKEKVAQNNAGNPRCPRVDYNYFENIEFTYKGNHWDLNKIFIDFNAKVSSYADVNADLTIGSVKYRTYLQSLNYPDYKDTVTINAIIYNAIKIYGEFDLPYFYNYQYGLLKITTSQKVWLKQMR